MNNQKGGFEFKVKFEGSPIMEARFRDMDEFDKHVKLFRQKFQGR